VQTACPINSHSDKDSVEINDCTCEAGYWGNIVDGNDGTPCQECTADNYCLGGLSFSACPDNAVSPQGSKYKTDCRCEGGFQDDNAGGCELCAANSYCQSGNVSTCPKHSVSTSGSDVAEDCICIPGYHGANGQACTMCPDNWYCPGGLDYYQCRDNSQSLMGSNSSDACICKPGTFEDPDDTGSRTCLDCTIGNWCHTGYKNLCLSGTTSDENSANVNDCFCKKGHFSAEGTGVCHPCTTGTYKKYTGLGQCTECPENTYSITPQSFEESDCKPCDINSQSDGGSTASDDCKCKAGYTGPDGFACTICKAGTYKSIIGSSQCTNCTVDTYSSTEGATSSLNCTECRDSSSSPAGSKSEDRCGCDSGFYDSTNE
jgi:hypothetical protein